MDQWWGLFIALAVGLPLLVGATLLDRRVRRRRILEMSASPQRGLETVDAHQPGYISQDEVDALPPPGRDIAAAVEPPTGERLEVGLPSPDFATATDRAELTDPVVVVIDDEITTIRLLLTLLTHTSTSPLVVVAAGFAPEVVGTLQANRKVLQMPVLAVQADDQLRARIAELLHIDILTGDDLRAGYIPHQSIGHAQRWTSTRTSTWIEPQA